MPGLDLPDIPADLYNNWAANQFLQSVQDQVGQTASDIGTGASNALATLSPPPPPPAPAPPPPPAPAPPEPAPAPPPDQSADLPPYQPPGQGAPPPDQAAAAPAPAPAAAPAPAPQPTPTPSPTPSPQPSPQPSSAFDPVGAALNAADAAGADMSKFGSAFNQLYTQGGDAVGAGLNAMSAAGGDIQKFADSMGTAMQNAPQAAASAVGGAAQGAQQAVGGAIDSSSHSSFAQSFAPYAQYAAQQLGIDPTWVTAMAASESNYGNAAGNELFGIKALPGQAGTTMMTHEGEYGGTQQNATFAAYQTPMDSVNAFVQLIKNHYPGAVGAQTLGDFVHGLKQGGYFTAAEPEYLGILQGISNQVGGDVQKGLGTAQQIVRGSSNDPGMGAPVNSPAQVENQRQFEQEAGLSTADAYTACGPVAAAAFAATYGRNPTPQEAIQLAQSVGWNPQTGMAGVGSEVALLNKLGVQTHSTTGVDWSAVQQSATSGNPVILDTPNHYLYVSGYDPSTGAYYVGKSGAILKGGSEWMTPDQIASVPGTHGAPTAAIYVDHPINGSQAPDPLTATKNAIGQGFSDLGTATNQATQQVTQQAQNVMQSVLNVGGNVASAVTSKIQSALTPAEQAAQTALDASHQALMDSINSTTSGAGALASGVSQGAQTAVSNAQQAVQNAAASGIPADVLQPAQDAINAASQTGLGQLVGGAAQGVTGRVPQVLGQDLASTQIQSPQNMDPLLTALGTGASALGSGLKIGTDVLNEVNPMTGLARMATGYSYLEDQDPQYQQLQQNYEQIQSLVQAGQLPYSALDDAQNQLAQRGQELRSQLSPADAASLAFSSPDVQRNEALYQLMGGLGAGAIAPEGLASSIPELLAASTLDPGVIPFSALAETPLRLGSLLGRYVPQLASAGGAPVSNIVEDIAGAGGTRTPEELASFLQNWTPTEARAAGDALTSSGGPWEALGNLAAAPPSVDPELQAFAQTGGTLHQFIQGPVGDTLRAAMQAPVTADERAAAQAILDDFSAQMGRGQGSIATAYPAATNADGLALLMRQLGNLADQGAAEKDWYVNSSKAIMDAAGGDPTEAEKIAQLVAIYSSKTGVSDNLNRALTAYMQYKQGANEITAPAMDWMNNRAGDLLFNGTTWDGAKTNNFYRNLMYHIDPEVWASLGKDANGVQQTGATVDIWMQRALNSLLKAPGNQTRYDFASRLISDVGAQRGWRPDQAQAAIWSAAKAGWEGSPIDAAGYHYGTAINERLANTFGSGMNEVLNQALQGPQGDMLARAFGVLGGNGEVAAPAARGGAKVGQVEPLTRNALNAYAAATGLLTEAPETGWARPFQETAQIRQNAALLDAGGRMSRDALDELQGHLDNLTSPGATRVIPSDSGAWVLNEGGAPNKAFQTAVSKAIDRVQSVDSISRVPAKYDGQVFSHDFGADPSGQTYRDTIRQSGSRFADQFAALEPVLRARISQAREAVGQAAGQAAGLLPQASRSVVSRAGVGALQGGISGGYQRSQEPGASPGDVALAALQGAGLGAVRGAALGGGLSPGTIARVAEEAGKVGENIPEYERISQAALDASKARVAARAAQALQGVQKRVVNSADVLNNLPESARSAYTATEGSVNAAADQAFKDMQRLQALRGQTDAVQYDAAGSPVSQAARQLEAPAGPEREAVPQLPTTPLPAGAKT